MTFYNPTKPLTEEQLRSRAPSVFATTKHDSRSDRFQPIATIDMVRVLNKEGFEVFEANQSRTLDASRRPFTRHLLRLRHADAHNSKYQVGDNLVEIALRNANDGSSQYELFGGLFRIRCLNGLISAIGSTERIKVRHNAKDLALKVVEGTNNVLTHSERLLSRPALWSGIEMSEDARRQFGEEVRSIRFGDKDGVTDTPFTWDQLLVPRRVEDTAKDLWTTFNVAQENSMKGGLTAFRPARLHEGRRTFEGRAIHSRQVTSVDRDVNLNIALWALGEKYAEILGPKVEETV